MIAAAVEGNLHAFWRTYDGVGERIEPQHALAFLSDSPFGLLNPVAAFRAGEDEADAVIARLLSAAAARGVDQWWWGGPGDSPDLADRLTAAGLTSRPPQPGMARSLEGWTAPEPPEGLEIAPVGDAEWVEYLQVFFAGFGLPESVQPAMGDAFAAISRHPSVHNFLGRLGGAPVACSSLVVDDAGTAGVWNVATLEAARGRGVGSALTAASMAAGVAAGARTAILVATPLGEPVYRAMGFETVCEMPMWSRLS